MGAAVAWLRDYVQRAWYVSAGALWLLWPLEWVYRLTLILRRLLYVLGWRRPWRAPVPVWVVGNITVGGTGKTPVVVALARALSAQGLRVGVVSRGYGAQPGRFPRRVLAGSDWRLSGDEPLLIARQTGAPVVIAPDRPAAVRELLAWQPVDVVLSDDGLQHRALARDKELVLLDGRLGLGNGHCLPVGPLREPSRRLRQVDHVLVRRGGAAHQCFDYVPEALINLHDGRQLAADASVLGAGVDAIAGIGAPAQFFALLRALGFTPLTREYPDHHAYVAADFRGLGQRPLIMTEKDAIKCAGIAPANSWYLRISARLPDLLVQQLAGYRPILSAHSQE
jgi:tetraacyldisaccharide 4'-kinase